ncbi:hypothetical protein F7Q99_04525 [Streptomyces kaniharaensis]|uniref:Uncharacterized protein n=1 Tax=Streptomyces kaniharaensis TaxID=212423 RepID=A0A6N7KLY7_9ACTN|nr:hypothetical protein [Streptomyces kaniharaensis]MQS11569.1 hypothetical protein [Streptomyces kaniharaensis]
MILVQAVLETLVPDGFGLWPVGEHEPYGFLTLHGDMTPADIGTAVACIANGTDPVEDGDRRPEPHPADPVDADPVDTFLYGLLNNPYPVAPGGFRVTDTATGAALLPGCCNGLDEWRDWLEVLDGGGVAGFGHGPSPLVERLGDVVRLTVDTDADTDTEGGSPVIELPVDELRRLIAGAEQDLRGFLRLAGSWAERQLPGYAAALTAALARVADPVEDD